MDAHLLKICEQYLEKKKKGREVEEKLLADPLTYGSSLLSKLPPTSDVEIRPPSRAGVEISISSGTYRPQSRNAWSRKVDQSRLSPIEEENEEVRVISLIMHNYYYGMIPHARPALLTIIGAESWLANCRAKWKRSL